MPDLKKHLLIILFTYISVYAYQLDFEEGKLPSHWKAQETNPKSHSQSTWIIQQETKPHQSKVLILTHAEENSGNTFNLFYTHSLSFLNGSIDIKFKAIKGKEDQGGGLIWRVQDKNNYYIARFNPLEDNFRLYYVKNGRRTTLASAHIKLDPKAWHSMKIIQDGEYFKAFLNSKLYLQGKDNHFPNAGGVGVWTKADAQTAFDDLIIKKR